ncbi:MAG: 6-phosphogluconate dehydrogenase, decarboxylating, partial [Myxococcaceae bacterium]|nr:6-phosphogluconate dehydrogenase, decarboxylating [Myxococcaceae bacterium]
AWPAPVEALTAAAAAENASVQGFKELTAFVSSLQRPRRIIMLVKAGEVVDKTIALLAPLLSPGDMLIDGGNEFFMNTERRARELSAKGFRYFGMGVSGGEEGARHGPSLMPGGDRSGYDELAPMLVAIAAKADGPCVTYVGPGGSGNYVKMVHNGIEYGDMQLIAEAYDVLKNVAGLSNDELADTFDEWNRGELESFLIEITATVFRKEDPEQPGQRLLDFVADRASMKGTGMWTVQQAAEIGAPVPTVAAAVDARALSSSADRQRSARLSGPTLTVKRDTTLVADVRAALYGAKICAYAQGMALLRAASTAHSWELNLAELARIWTGGCIIRARLLRHIKEAFANEPGLSNLLLDDWFRREFSERQAGFRRVVALGASVGIALPAHASALNYYDTLRRARLPQNLTQAQRDYFGAHTYERTDKPGSFHSDWADTRGSTRER